MGETRHVLLINLGRGNQQLPPPGYNPTTYLLPDGQSCHTHIAGLALWWWLERSGRPPVSVLFACTDVAWQDKAEVARQEAHRLGLAVDRIEHHEQKIPRILEDVWQVLPPLEEWLQRHGAVPGHPLTLHLDITHAFRAIPIAHTWMSLYLQRRGLIVPGVWGYGAFDLNAKEETPYLDLSHLLDLAQWAEAVRAFRDRLDTDAITALLDPLEREARRTAVSGSPSAPPPGQLGAVLRAAKAASAAFRAGLPLEVGVETRRHLGRVTADDVRQAASALLPPHVPVAEELFHHVESLAVRDAAKRNAKMQLPLDDYELQRQLRLVEAWVRADMVDTALRALRELVVSRALLARGTPPTEWLQRSPREHITNLLNALADCPPSPLREEERALGTLWWELRNHRNPLAHAGMQTDGVDLGTVRQVLEGRLLPEFRRLYGLSEVWQLADLSETPPEGDGAR